MAKATNASAQMILVGLAISLFPFLLTVQGHQASFHRGWRRLRTPVMSLKPPPAVGAIGERGLYALPAALATSEAIARGQGHALPSLIEDPPTRLTRQHRLPSGDRDEGDKEKADIMVRPLQVCLGGSARGACARIALQAPRSRLYTSDEDHGTMRLA